MKIFRDIKRAYTLAEIIIVLVVISVVVACTMRVAKNRFDNITAYTYYSAYGVLNDVTAQMLADYSPTKNEYTEIAYWKFFRFVPKFYCLSSNFVLAACVPRYEASYRPPSSSESGLDGSPNSSITTPSGCISRGEPYCPNGGTPSLIGCTYYCEQSCNDTSSGDTGGGFVPSWTTCPEGTHWDSLKNMCVPDNTPEINCPEGTKPQKSGLTIVCVPDTSPNACTLPSEEEQQQHYCPYGQKFNETTCKYEDIQCNLGEHWSSTNCKCEADGSTVPRKGINFCKLFVSLVNTKAGTTCNGSAISSDTTDFGATGVTEDFTLRNGMKVYNVSQNPIRIADLVGNTDVGTVIKADGTQIKTNEWGYVLYIDIDGTSGDSKLWEDVYPFYVTLSGRVIPAYKTDNASDYNLYGGGSRYYLQTSIQVDTSDASGSRQYWLVNNKSISFREAACRSGYVGANTNYCKRGTPITQNGTCASENSSCTIKKVSPIRVF